MPIITGRTPSGNVVDVALDEDGKLRLGGTTPVSGTITATTTPQVAISISGVSVTVPISGFPTSIGISSCTGTLPVSGFPLSIGISSCTVTVPVSGFPVSISLSGGNTVALSGFPTTTGISGISVATSGASSSLLITDAPYWDYQTLAYSGTDTVALTSITYKVGGSGGTVVLVTTYGYDANLNVTSIART